MIATALAVLLIALQLADAYTTYRVIYEGAGREANPFQARLQKVVPGKWTWLITMKILGVGLGAFFMYLPPTQEVTGALAVLCLMYAYVVANNWQILAAHKLR